MKLFIPELGSKLTLIQDWKCPIEWENRNLTLIKFFNSELSNAYKTYEQEWYQTLCSNTQRTKTWKAWQDFINANPLVYTFPKGTVLEVDRIYIRKGAEDFSSLTFKWRTPKMVRFWAKLEDVNRIEFK